MPRREVGFPRTQPTTASPRRPVTVMPPQPSYEDDDDDEYVHEADIVRSRRQAPSPPSWPHDSPHYPAPDRRHHFRQEYHRVETHYVEYSGPGPIPVYVVNQPTFWLEFAKAAAVLGLIAFGLLLLHVIQYH
jgi:hypothetical protein